ncbi:MAG: hypothetical protein FWF00_04670 [Endomicrobia bacterium]|nr:hypothetical protein [Endomicrobiia bacterium]MCL2506964.1 hypothetical protein [Endomicrobiia bacterium]
MTQENKSCSCPHCKKEIKDGCFSAGVCKPCGVKNNVKICPKCKAEYLPQYEECPACTTNKE